MREQPFVKPTGGVGDNTVHMQVVHEELPVLRIIHGPGKNSQFCRMTGFYQSRPGAQETKIGVDREAGELLGSGDDTLRAAESLGLFGVEQQTAQQTGIALLHQPQTVVVETRHQYALGEATSAHEFGETRFDPYISDRVGLEFEVVKH